MKSARYSVKVSFESTGWYTVTDLEENAVVARIRGDLPEAENLANLIARRLGGRPSQETPSPDSPST